MKPRLPDSGSGTQPGKRRTLTSDGNRICFSDLRRPEGFERQARKLRVWYSGLGVSAMARRDERGRTYVLATPRGAGFASSILATGLYPVSIVIPASYRGKITPALWGELRERNRSQSLRSVAEDYEVSYETVRRTLRRADSI